MGKVPDRVEVAHEGSITHEQAFAHLTDAELDCILAHAAARAKGDGA